MMTPSHGKVPLTLHLGARKTGTTALQRLLFSSRDALADRHGTLVPSAFSRRNTGATDPFDRAHHQLAHLSRKALRDPAATSRFADELLKLHAEVDSSGCSHVVMTTEVLDDASDAMVHHLYNTLSIRYDLRVVYSVRRVDEYCDSRLKQTFKEGACPPDQLATHRHPFETLFTWAKLLPKEHLRVLHYGSPSRVTYNHRVLEAIGLPHQQFDWPYDEANPSLGRLASLSAVAYFQHLQSGGRAPQDFKSRDRFTQRIQRLNRLLPEDEPWSWLSFTERLRIFDACFERSAELARNFLSPDDANAFLDRSAVRPKPTMATGSWDAGKIGDFVLHLLATVSPAPSRAPETSPDSTPRADDLKT